jgi:hypothetical protein
MPTAVGPNTKGEENLVFGYDLGDTSNSYIGEPTVNLVTNSNTRTFDAGSDGNWTYQTVAGSGSISTENPKSGTHSAKLTRSGAGGEVNYYWNAGPGLSLTPGSTYTFSMDVWCDKPGMAKLFSYLAGTNGSSDFHPGDSKWHRLSMQFTPAESTAAAQIRFGILTSNSNYPVTAYFDNAQIEQNTHVTPFTEGTRSATQGLVDLTGNSTIDLTNVSFDSNAQMTFDGTDDTIALGSSSTFNITSEMSVSAWIKPDSISGWKGIFGGAISGFVHFQLYNGGINVYVYGPAAAYGNPDSVSIGTNVWTNVGFTFGNNTLKVYLNGEQLPTTVTGNGANITSNSDVRVGWAYATSRLFQGSIKALTVHNRALTASEVASNYNAIKGRFNI